MSDTVDYQAVLDAMLVALEHMGIEKSEEVDRGLYDKPTTLRWLSMVMYDALTYDEDLKARIK